MGGSLCVDLVSFYRVQACCGKGLHPGQPGRGKSPAQAAYIAGSRWTGLLRTCVGGAAMDGGEAEDMSFRSREEVPA